jgi:hypothetical protein
VAALDFYALTEHLEYISYGEWKLPGRAQLGAQPWHRRLERVVIRSIKSGIEHAVRHVRLGRGERKVA